MKPYSCEGPRSTGVWRGTERRNTRTEDTHGPARFSPTTKSTTDTNAPGGKEWHDTTVAVAEEDEEEDDGAQKDEIGETFSLIRR